MKPRILSTARLSFPLAAAIAALLFGTQAHAAFYYWDSNSITAGLGNTGSLTWGTSANAGNAYGGSGNTVVINGLGGVSAPTYATGDLMYFGTVNLALGSAASTIGIVASGVSVNTIVFGAGQGAQGVTLSGGGGAIAFSTTVGTIVANNTGANTIGAVLTGSAGMTLIGPGTVNLTGANLFTGGLTLSGGGTLNVGNGSSGSLTSQALTFSNGGGLLNVQSLTAGSTQAMGALTFSTTGVGESTVQSTYGTSGNAALTFTSLAARGAGATGNFIVSGGTNGSSNEIVLTGASTGALLDRGLFFGGNKYAAYDSSGYVRAYGSGDASYLAAPTGATLGSPTSTSNVELTTGAITAQTTASANTINLGTNNLTLQDTAQILSVNGILSAGASSASIATAGKLQGTAAGNEIVIRVNGSTDGLSIAPIIQNYNGGGTASALTKSGAGTVTLAGTNTYTGTTTINSGALALSGGSAIMDTGAVVLANAAGATMLLNASETIGSLSGGGFSGGNMNVGSNILTIANANSQTFGGTFSGSGGVTITTGTLSLSNPNSFAGTITLNGGALTFTMDCTNTTVTQVSSGGAIKMANGTALNLSPATTLAITGQSTLGRVAWQSAPGAGATGYTISNPINITSGTATLSFASMNDTKWNLTGNVTGSSTPSTPTTLAFSTPTGAGRQNYLFTGIIADGSGGALSLNAALNTNTGGQGSYLNLAGANTFTGSITVTNSGTAVNYVAIGGEIYSTGGTNRTPVTGSGSLGTTGTLTGNYSGTISLAANTVLDYLSSATQTLGGVISGAGSLLKEGSGNLTLSAVNTFSGTTTVSAGKIILGNALALQNSAYVTTGSNGSTIGIDLTGYTTPILGGLSGAVSLASAFTAGYTGSVTALTLNPQAGATPSYSGIIANGASGMTLTKTGAGIQTLSGANSYTGATTVNAGTLALGNGGNINSTAAVTVNSPAVLAVKQTASSSTNAIAGSIALASGSALNMADGFTSQLNVTGASTLAPASGVSPVLTFDIIGAVADQLNITGAATAGAAGAKISIPIPATAITPGTYAVITGGVSSALNTGFSLSSSMLPTSGGLYTLSLAGSSATAANVTVAADTNALYWKGGSTDLNAAANWTTDQAGTTASGSLTSVNDLTFNATGAGNLTGSSLTAGLAVNGVYFLSGAASVTIATSANQLTINGGGITNASANAMTINNPITLGTAQTWTNNGTGLLTIGGAVANASNLLTVAGTGNTTVTGIIGNGGGGLTKQDTGTLTLSGANTFTGVVTINAGTLAISAIDLVANANPLGQSAATAGNLILNGGTLKYTGAALSTDRLFSLQSSSSIDASGSGALNFTNTGSMDFNSNTAAKTLTLTGTNTGTNTLAAIIADNTGATTVTKTGAGTWVLANATNNYSGGTLVNAGTLIYASKTAFGPGTITLAGGTKLQKITEEANSAGLAMTNNLTLNGQVEMNVDFGGVKDQWFSGKISGIGSLRVTGARAVSLTGNNDFSGGVLLDTASNPWIRLGSATGLGTGTLTINTTAGAQVQGLGAYVALTSGSGVTNNIVINSGATFNLGGDANNMRLSGIISGAGSLNKSDAFAVTFYLDGANTYTGTTRVATGALSINSIANVGASSAIGAPTTTVNGKITLGSGAGTGTLIYTGSTAGTDRTIQVNDVDSTGTGGATIQNDGSGALTFTAATFNNAYTLANLVTRTLTLQGSNGGQIQGAIQNNSGTGLVALTKAGAGTWTLTGTNTYTGATNVNLGTLALVGGSQASPITVATGASLGFTLGSPVSSSSSVNLTNGTVKITGTPTLSSYTLMTTTGGITGPVNLATAIPGYNLVIDGTALKLNATGTPYSLWSGGSAANLDPNNDGVTNGVAWVLGAIGPNENVTAKLPTLDNTSDPDFFIFNYRRSQTAAADANTAIKVLYGSSLTGWTDATPSADIIITPTTDFYASGIDKVEVKIRRTLATGNKLFARLNVVVGP